MRAVRLRAASAVLLVVATLVASGIAPASAGTDPGGGSSAAHPTSAAGLTARSLTATSTVEGSKATSSRAESDPDLIARKDAKRVNVMIKLDYDSIATYDGSLQNLPATSPSRTGQPLTTATATKSAYAHHLAGEEARIVSAIRSKVPSTRIGRSLRVVYGGVSATVPANQAKALLGVDGVVAVQSDTLEHPLSESPQFIDAPPVWAAQGGQALAGHGVLFGDLDTGLWPEHPMFADNPALGPAPTDSEGHALTCNFGDDPLTPATDVFPCNHKLVGGDVFLDTYLDPELDNPEEVYPDTARDSDGHGTHTSSTAAGGVVAHSPILGADHGPISGVAPGAWVAEYKVCGSLGCFDSDATAAIEQAIFDGVDVINFSISGGVHPLADPVELAFLDAYAAGVFVAASAGNDGPTASTANHLSAWVTSVAASTQQREFATTLHLASEDGATLDLHGSTVTQGITTPTPVILASDVPDYTGGITCGDEPDGPDTFAGFVVVCERGGAGIGRVQKGHNLFEGGAEGMILYNPTLQDTETDNHWLPAVHLELGDELRAFLDDHDDVTATWEPGSAQAGQGDVMAGFSSRGPAGALIKPDVTAPGVQILAGHTPTPDTIDVGPPGELYQAIAGTSMSSPHVAGAGILVAAAHPDWDPGQIKSALMMTATTAVVKEDKTTPADAFDMGSGRIVVSQAVSPGLTISDDATHFFDVSDDPVHAIDANIASVDAPVMPGRVTTTRVVTNVGSGSAAYKATTTAPAGTTITVSPATFTIAAGATRTLTITISADDGVTGQQLGRIDLKAAGRNPLHLPVAFVPSQTAVGLTSSCAAADIGLGGSTHCTVTAQNDSFNDVPVHLTSTVDPHLTITGSDAPSSDAHHATKDGVLAGREPGVPSVAPYAPLGDGFLPLEIFSTEPTPIGDEEALNFNVPGFVYNGETYDTIGVVSDGYIVVGKEATSEDIDFEGQELPDPTPPNNVLAPFWTDLSGEGQDDPAPAGILVDVLTDSDTGQQWTVVQFELNAFGTDTLKVFQVWLGANGEQDITFNYDPDSTNVDGLSSNLTVGAENEPGTGGQDLDDPDEDNLPPGDIDVTSTDPEPGDSLTYSLDVKGTTAGVGVLTSEMTSPELIGTTVVHSKVDVVRPPTPDELYVAQVFGDLLGRSPTATELALWPQWLHNGVPRATFTHALTHTDEYYGRVTGQSFQLLLHRDPTAGERAAWITALRNGGLTQAWLISNLAATQAYKTLAGGTDTAVIKQMFHDLVGRPASNKNVSDWLARLGSGTTRRQMALNFYQSLEARKHRVNGMYQQLLGHAPTAAMLTTRANALASQPDSAVSEQLTALNEYYQRAQT